MTCQLELVCDTERCLVYVCRDRDCSIAQDVTRNMLYLELPPANIKNIPGFVHFSKAHGFAGGGNSESHQDSQRCFRWHHVNHLWGGRGSDMHILLGIVIVNSEGVPMRSTYGA